MKHLSVRFLKKTILAGSLFASLLAQPVQADEFRAFWVDAFGSGFLNAGEVTTLVNNCHAYNFNAVVVQMRRRGDAFYMPQAPNGDPRTTAIAAGYDALQEIINQCHAATPRIEVHCWVAANLIWGPTTAPSQAGHVYNSHPEYLNKDASGNTLFAEGYYLDPGNPAAMQWNYNMAKDIVSRYDIDGFHWDYIRYPQENSGYNEVSVSRYNAEFGLTGQPAATSSQFKTWRRRQVTDFIRWTSADLLEIRPSLMISASVFANRTDATSFRFQDWAAWANEGIIDFLLPMNYVNAVSNPGLFESRVNDIFANQGVRRAYIGVGAYLNSKENTVAQLNYVRNKPMLGAAFYSYRTPNSGTVNQAATFQYVKDNYQPNYEPVPTLPWIANPTKAIIKGTVTRSDNSDPIYNATINLDSSPARTQKTEAHGKYAFFEVDPGSYTLTAGSGGSNSAPANVTVAAGGIYNVDFTIALPPIGDTVPPIITFVTSSSVSSNSAVVTWTTDEASDSAVNYGTTTAYGSTVSNGSMVTSHSITLSGLTADTTYHYRVKSKDATGNEGVSVNFQFKTTPAVADIIVDNPAAVTTGTWTLATSAADKFGADYRNRSMTGTGANSVTFTPNVIVAGYYQVYEWHPAGGNRETNAAVIVTSSSGVVTNRVNQRINGGKWNFIGTYPFNAGTGGNIRISDHGVASTNQVMADAIRMVYLPETISAPIIVDNPEALVTGAWSTNTTAADRFGANYYFRSFNSGNFSVLFTPNLPVAGTYQVSEWHSAGSNRATNTPHVVTFNGGVTTNRINQQISGGQWNHFGTFRFTAGSSGSVRITAAATGPTNPVAQIMADAIRWVFLPPPVPGELTAEAINTSEIHLSWIDNSSDEANFILARSTTPGGPYTVIATLPANATSYTDSGLTLNTTYYYAIKATTGPGGASAYSNEASATTLPEPPPAPHDLSAVAVSSSQIDLAWQNGEELDFSYVISRSASATGPFSDIGAVDSRIRNFSDTGLNPLTTYYYMVRAQNAGGDSANSNVASATTLSDIPAAPTDLTATAAGPNQVDLTWTDNASNEDSIAVVRAPFNGTYSTVATLPANTTGYSDLTVSGHTTYFYYLRVANHAGSADSAAVQVTTPNSAPVANAGNDQAVAADSNCQASVTLDGTGSSDADYDSLTYTWSGSFGTASGVSPNVNLSLGSHVVTLTVDDGNGGVVSDQVTIVVEDTTAPTLTLNGDSAATVECHSSYADAGATAADNCSGDLTGSVSISGSVDVNTPGTYTLNYSVSDAAGNSSSATRTVTVVDTTSPVIAINGSASVTAECHSDYVDAGASASDACAGDLTAGIVVSGSVDADTPGVYSITYSVSDPSGNTTFASRTVTVVDTTAPAVALNGSPSLTIECHSAFSDDGATASDLCAGDLTGSISVSGSVDANTPGTYTLTYSVTDPSGNSASATRTVEVLDRIAPTLSLNGAASMTLTSHQPFIDPGATASDICGGDLTSQIVVSGSVDPHTLGTYAVTYTVTDASGNSSSAVRMVNVVDTSAPTLTLNGAASMTAECHGGFVDPGATANDDYAGDLTSQIVVSGSVDANTPGTYTLTYTVSDPSGNTVSAARTVTVVDTTAPVISSATASPNVLWAPNHQMVVVTVSAPTADACDSAATTRIISVSSNDPDPNDWQILSDTTVNLRAEKMKKIDRIYTVTVEATDAAGNKSTRTVTVTVPHDQGTGN